jgi:hypothetical protein
MTTTRKRARTTAGQFQADNPSTPERNEAYIQDLPLNVDTLAAFMALEQPDRARLQQGLDLATQAAAAYISRPITGNEPHGIRHGIHMLAAQLLIADRLDATPTGQQIPGVVRYLWKTAHAGS